jgi:hypothetical protein
MTDDIDNVNRLRDLMEGDPDLTRTVADLIDSGPLDDAVQPTLSLLPVTPPPPPPPVDKAAEKAWYILKSTLGDEFDVDIRQFIALFNSYINAESSSSKNRLDKIIEAAVKAASHKKSKYATVGTVSTTAAIPFESSMLNSVMHTPVVKIGGFVAVAFYDEADTVVSYIGKVTGMTNRPSGKAVRWRLPVPLKDVTNTLWILCSWFQPIIVNGTDTPSTTLCSTS